jgi:heat shock protein HslJ
MRAPALAAILFVAACATPMAGSGNLDVAGAWSLQSIAGAPVLAGAHPSLTLAGDGRANGNGGCNAFGGSYAQNGASLRFSQMISTMMACARPGLTSEQVMGQEHRFLSALNGALRASEPEAGVLVLTTASGEALRFTRAAPAGS